MPIAALSLSRYTMALTTPNGLLAVAPVRSVGGVRRAMDAVAVPAGRVMEVVQVARPAGTAHPDRWRSAQRPRIRPSRTISRAVG